MDNRTGNNQSWRTHPNFIHTVVFQCNSGRLARANGSQHGTQSKPQPRQKPEETLSKSSLTIAQCYPVIMVMSTSKLWPSIKYSSFVLKTNYRGHRVKFRCGQFKYRNREIMVDLKKELDRFAKHQMMGRCSRLVEQYYLTKWVVCALYV